MLELNLNLTSPVFLFDFFEINTIIRFSVMSSNPTTFNNYLQEEAAKYIFVSPHNSAFRPINDFSRYDAIQPLTEAS